MLNISEGKVLVKRLSDGNTIEVEAKHRVVAAADHHSHGCNLSFADGHVEQWRWRYLKGRTQGSKAESETDLADLRRLQAATLSPMN